jgi:hypothetical protein
MPAIGRATILAFSSLLLAACDQVRSFGAMNDEERLAIGSRQLLRACAAAGDPHELGPVAKFELRRGREYLSYVAAHAAPGDLPNYIDMHALEACLDAEGMRRTLTPLVLRAGSDQQAEAIVNAAATPQFYCTVDFDERFTPAEAERLRSACSRLGLR